jgi:hypothetical protein
MVDGSVVVMVVAVVVVVVVDEESSGLGFRGIKRGTVSVFSVGF